MDAIGPTTRLAHDLDMRPIKLLRDWDVDEPAGTVFHRPSKLVFLIDYDPQVDGQPVKPSAVSARAVHVCDGGALPPEARLRQIGKDAIHAFVLLAEVCHEPTNPDDIPF